MIKKYLVEEATVNPIITLSLNDNWMDFTIRYVVDFKKRRGTKDRIYTQILDEIARTNGLISRENSGNLITQIVRIC
jgi:hypothetical protein